MLSGNRDWLTAVVVNNEVMGFGVNVFRSVSTCEYKKRLGI
jgi:hypothetical protein